MMLSLAIPNESFLSFYKLQPILMGMSAKIEKYLHEFLEIIVLNNTKIAAMQWLRTCRWWTGSNQFEIQFIFLSYA